MTTPTPGWYRDPRDDSKLRWWDGGSWTSNQRPREAASAPPVAPPHSAAPTALPAAPVRAALPAAPAPAPAMAIATSVPMMTQTSAAPAVYSRPTAVAVAPPVVLVPPTVVASPSNELATVAPLRGPWNDLPLQSTPTQKSGSPEVAPELSSEATATWSAPHVAIATRPSPANAAATTLALLPALTLILAAASGIGGWVVAPTLVIGVPVVLVVSFVLRWVLGARDRSKLAKRGFARRPALALVLLPLFFYFLARGLVLRRQGGRGFGPLVLLVLSSLLSLAAAFGLGIVSPTLSPSAESLHMLAQYVPDIRNLIDGLPGPLQSFLP